MELLKLYFRGEEVGRFELAEQPLAIGRGSGCDIVLHDPQVGGCRWLVMRRHGTAVLYDFEATGRGAETHLPLERMMPLGAHYALLRCLEDVEARPRATQRVRRTGTHGASLRLQVGRGSEARCYRMARPLRVGARSDNDVVLEDRTVSACHCRLEPGERGVLLRDLDSANGTWVNGMRLKVAELGEGGVIRVGHTDLRLVGDEEGAGLVARSEAMRECEAEARRWAPLPWPVLILGESGVGKEEIARLLHRAGERDPFVVINAGGVSKDLVGSELFGHERGAFTGAEALRRGVFEQAHGGTLFIDEIGELPPELQTQLLRVLETGRVRRMGGEREIAVDVRVVSATHRDLHAMALDGSFRLDLYYRLAAFVTRIAPLRERPEDTEALAQHFLRDMAPHVGLRELDEGARERLFAHDWPGNARELRNVLRVAAVAAGSRCLTAADVERAIRRVSGDDAVRSMAPDTLRVAVERHGGNLSAAARSLGIARSTLRDRLRAAREVEQPRGQGGG